MLQVGHLSGLMGEDALRVIAAEGGKPEKDEKKTEEVKDGPPPAPEAEALPAAMPLVMGPQFTTGMPVRDVFSGQEGVVAEQPVGDHGDVVFVTFGDKTHPIRRDQLEPTQPALSSPAAALPGAAPLGEGEPAPGSPLPGAAPAPELSTKPQALPEVPEKGFPAKARRLREANLKATTRFFAADPVVEKVAKAVEGKNLVDMRGPLEALFGKKAVDFSFEPVPHFRVRVGGKTLLLCHEKYAEANERDAVVGTTAIGFMASLTLQASPKTGRVPVASYGDRDWPDDADIDDHIANNDGLLDRVKQSVAKRLMQEWGADGDMGDVNDPDDVKQFIEHNDAKVTKDARYDIAVNLATWNQEDDWDNLTSTLTALMQELGAEVWHAEGRNMGWRQRSGHKDFRAADGEQLLRAILPNTDTSIEVYQRQGAIELTVYHHDAPTGETYTITPGKAEDVEASLQARRVRTAKPKKARVRTGKGVRVSAEDMGSRLVTGAQDPRKMTYTAYLEKLKVDKVSSHEDALAVIGYLPQDWDLIVARLAKDGVTLTAAKEAYDVEAMRRFGYTNAETRFILAGKGVPVHAVDKVLKLLAGKPTTPPPKDVPAGKVPVWDDTNNMWVIKDAAAPGTPTEVAGAAVRAAGERQALPEMPEMDAIVKAGVEAAIDKAASGWDTEGSVEAVEHKSRSGFMAYTEGGYLGTAFTTLEYMNSTGYQFSNPEVRQKLDGFIERYEKMALEQFREDNAEALKGIPEDKQNYHDLYELGKGDLAEKLSELEHDSLAEETVMLSVGVNYFAPGNRQNKSGKPEFYVYAVVNWEAPYHRSASAFYHNTGSRMETEKVVFEEDIVAETAEQLQGPLNAALEKAAAALD